MDYNNETKKNIPPVKVELTEREYTALEESLNNMAHNGSEEEQLKAQKVIDKILRYTRDVTDEEGYNRKRICFYDSEAAVVIESFVKNFGGAI